MATITARGLTVTGVAADNKTYDATRTATLTGAAAVAPLLADVVTIGGTGSGLFDTKNVGTGKSVSVTGYSISGDNAANYNLIQPVGP